MLYSIEPKIRIYVRGYGFLFFAKKWGIKIVKNLLILPKKPTTGAIKTATHRVIQKIAETAGEWNTL